VDSEKIEASRLTCFSVSALVALTVVHRRQPWNRPRSRTIGSRRTHFASRPAAGLAGKSQVP